MGNFLPDRMSVCFYLKVGVVPALRVLDLMGPVLVRDLESNRTCGMNISIYRERGFIGMINSNPANPTTAGYEWKAQ